MLNNPRILIADEPTANLDSQRSQELLAVLHELVAMGKTVLVSSHDPLVFEAAGVSRVVELHDGRLVEGAAC
jgi:putative ABC transport system ATP-binding protein